MIYISENLKNLSKELSPLYVVGGFMRDSLLGISSTDIDLAGIYTINELIDVLGKQSVVIKNKALNTAQIIFEGVTYEYSTFRKEEYAGGGHNPKKVEFVSDILIDAKRRDFSCNAIYYELHTKTIIDPYGGVLDIKNKLVRMIEDSLRFDGVRILRMIRLSVNLGFEIENQTWETAKRYASNLEHVTPISWKMEMSKINPQKAAEAERLLGSLKH